jgi:AsmA protein
MTALGEAERASRPAIARGAEPAPWRPIAIIAFAAFAVAAALIGPQLFERPFLASLIEGRVCKEARVECHVTGPISARLLPFPMIEIDELTLTFPDRKITVAAPHVAAELRALPLLFGRLSVNHLALSGAAIEIAAPPGGMRVFASADGAGNALMDAIIAADRGGDRLTRISLDRSRILLRSESARHDIAVEAVSGMAAWPRAGGVLNARFTGFVAGERAELNLEGPALADLTRTEGSPLSANVSLGGAWLSYRGRLVKAPDLVVAGALEAVLPSAKHLIKPLHRLRWPSWLPDPALHVVGKAFITARGVDFEEAEFMIGRSRFSGGMSLRMTSDGRPSFSGTVATQRVELDDLALLRPAEVVLPSFGRLPDLDLRMSARTAKFGGWTIDGLAAGLILAERRLDLTLSQSSSGEIGAKLHLVATPDDEGVAVKLQASSDKLDVGPFLSGFAVNPGLTGAGSLNLSLEGHGDNLARLERSLAGKARMQMQKGAFSIALDEKSTALADAGGAGESGGQIVSRRFSEAGFAGVAERGVLALTEGWVGEGASRILIGGKLDLADRRVDLSLGSNGEPPAEAPWRLRVSGSWSAPNAWRVPPVTK